MIYHRAHYKPIKKISLYRQGITKYGPRKTVLSRGVSKKVSTDLCDVCSSLFLKQNDEQTVCSSCKRMAAL